VSTYRAKTIVTMDGPLLENGAVTVVDDRIAEVGQFGKVGDGGEVIDLGEVVLLPGLINLHCHLDFTSLRGAIEPQRSFADWIRQINGLRRELTDEEYLASIASGFTEARRWGTTTIANVESLPALLSRMPAPPLRTWWFAELIDVQPRVSAETMIDQALATFRDTEAWRGGFGLSPHAPYTASPQLSKLAAAAARERRLPLTIHLAESREEMEMFRDGQGPMFDLLHQLGRSMEDCGRGKTPLAVMSERVALDENWIAVHLNELAEEDFARLEHAPRFHIAHCPRSSRYFKHRPFELRRLLELRFNIGLGTDSLASNSSLSLFAEMGTLRDEHPWLAPQKILEMATLNAARALRQQNALGKIRPGFQADLVALPIQSHSGDLFEKIISWEEEVDWTLLAGRELAPVF
jgi:cytosine/adenosine deaminase-related metal-dependent hydrolase